MSVGAVGAADVAVVEQGELADERVGVGHDGFAEAAQLRVAVAPGQAAEDLVVGAVLLDDIEDMPDGAVVDGEAGTVGDRGPSGCRGRLRGGRREVGVQVDHGDGALKVVGVAGLPTARRHRAVALGVDHEGGVLSGARAMAMGKKPACRKPNTRPVGRSISQTALSPPLHR